MSEDYQEFLHPAGVSLRIYGLTEEHPALRLEAWCEECGQKVSESTYDASQPPTPGEVETIGERDAEAAMEHMRREHGR